MGKSNGYCISIRIYTIRCNRTNLHINPSNEYVDYNFKVAEGKTNTIQFSIDMLNVGNMISSDWGLIQQPNNVQPIGVSFDDPGSNEPTYTFNPDQKDTFGYDSSLLSRWQMQFGLRYIF
jgi:hypothetical protein